MTAGDDTADGRGDDADAVDSEASTGDAAGVDGRTDIDTHQSSEFDDGRVDVEDDADAVPLGESQTLDPAVRFYWIVRSVIRAATLAVVALLFATVLNQTILPLPVRTVTVTVFALFATLGVARSVLRYGSWAYAIREESLFLRRGVFTQVQTVVPYVRVQHIDTRRGAVERLFGLSSLVVYTAGSRGADVTIPGLSPARASSLQTRLKHLAIESEEEDAV